jgi:hypothetical protein
MVPIVVPERNSKSGDATLTLEEASRVLPEEVFEKTW